MRKQRLNSPDEYRLWLAGNGCVRSAPPREYPCVVVYAYFEHDGTYAQFVYENEFN